jgi:hypothetical protein
MGVGLLADFARVAVITVFLAAFGCIVAAGIAVPMSQSPMQPGEEAFRLAKGMGLLGGAAALVASMSSTLYFFLVGEASGRAFLLVEMGLIGAAAATWLAVSVILAGGRSTRN